MHQQKLPTSKNYEFSFASAFASFCFRANATLAQVGVWHYGSGTVVVGKLAKPILAHARPTWMEFVHALKFYVAGLTFLVLQGMQPCTGVAGHATFLTCTGVAGHATLH